MKNIFALILSFYLSIIFLAAQPKKTEEIKIKTSAVCDMCKSTLEKAMAYEKGIKKSDLDVASAVITISYNPQKTNPDKIRKAIAESGYDADEVKANTKAYNNLNACCKKDAHH